MTESVRVLGTDHSDTLTARGNLATAYELAGRNQEAVDLYHYVVTGRLRFLGGNHPQTLASRHNLALAYESADRLDEAIDLYTKVLDECLRVLSPAHPLTEAVRRASTTGRPTFVLAIATIIVDSDHTGPSCALRGMRVPAACPCLASLDDACPFFAVDRRPSKIGGTIR